MLKIENLAHQILASRQTAAPIIAAVLTPDRWNELRLDATAIQQFGKLQREPVQATLAGVPLYLDTRATGATVYTDRGALAEHLNRRSVSALMI